MMKKIIMIILPILVLLSGCTKEDIPDEKYEVVARLYVETLWRDIEDTDNTTLNLCSDNVKKKIQETSEQAQELLRKREYLTKDEVLELIGPLDEYYAFKKQEYIDLSAMGEYVGAPPKDIDAYQPVKVLTKETYPVEIYEGTKGRIILEDNNAIYFLLPELYNGEYELELTGYSNGIYKYTVNLGEKEFFIYLDVENDQVVRLKEDIDTTSN